MTDLVPLLVGAALVGVLHMSAPDHWVTLCILSRASGWNRKKLFGISLATATGHAVLSAALGFGIAVAGLVVLKVDFFLHFLCCWIRNACSWAFHWC